MHKNREGRGILPVICLECKLMRSPRNLTAFAGSVRGFSIVPRRIRDDFGDSFTIPYEFNFSEAASLKNVGVTVLSEWEACVEATRESRLYIARGLVRPRTSDMLMRSLFEPLKFISIYTLYY